MAFGKRPLTPASTATVAAVLPHVRTSEVRHIDLRDTMLRLLQTTGSIAEAIRTNGTIMLSGVIDDTIDPSAAPVELRDIAEHFSFSDGTNLLHPFFGYATPDRPEQIDPGAQFQILELVTRIRELNAHCQDGHRNEALGVALQSTKLPRIVDGILVAAAFFAAYFENLATTQAFITGSAQGRLLPDFAMLKASYHRHKLMAYDRMLSPENLDRLSPNPVWPQLGVEIPRRHEAGEQFVHGIYFPSAYARKLADRAGRVPQESALVVA